ncbi:hypothetical protein CDAR_616271 [Caerostris darwini]|uniref:Uncharacterized protein n=1 Tax=Caerostris darwini TaxID=1538125 RepID=A0AAV4PSN0_9ARAC|nr:hypothetical protein CDAR_616271 [Caerostris darwini]
MIEADLVVFGHHMCRVFGEIRTVIGGPHTLAYILVSTLAPYPSSLGTTWKFEQLSEGPIPLQWAKGSKKLCHRRSTRTDQKSFPDPLFCRDPIVQKGFFFPFDSLFVIGETSTRIGSVIITQQRKGGGFGFFASFPTRKGASLGCFLVLRGFDALGKNIAW